MPLFEPGVQLARAYYRECVAAIIGDVPHAAARIGWGSDVLGYDTPRSTDHGWGPHLQVFVASSDVETVAARVEHSLPDEFRGWPTHFGWDAITPRHWVEITTLGEWLVARLGCDPRPTPSTVDWLAMPHQRLRETTSGEVFHDSTGEVVAARAALSWYPDDIWRYVLAAQWQRISQEEAFVGRTAEVGDDLGSRIITARLVRMLMQQCFMVERVWPPYAKWFGSAFADLDAADELAPLLAHALAAPQVDARHTALGAAYEAVARRCNSLHLSDPVDPTSRNYYGRPYVVLHAERLAVALRERIVDPVLRTGRAIGAFDQWVDSTDVLEDVDRQQRLRSMYA